MVREAILQDKRDKRHDNANRRGGYINLRSGPQLREYEEIANRIASERRGRVLDWGCGAGQVSDLLARRGVEVESLDYREHESPRVVALELFPHIKAHMTNDPVKLPFPDHHFATVLSCGVLEHVRYPTESLKELRRVLEPGGRLLVYKLPNRWSYLEAIARALGYYYHGKLPYDRIYERRKAIELLSSQSFRVDDFRRTNMLPLTVTHPLAWRYTDAIWRINRWCEKLPIANWFTTNLEVDAKVL